MVNLLVDSIANARVLLLVNYRPEYRHDWGSRTCYTQLRLDPLGKESAEERLDSLLTSRVSAASAADAGEARSYVRSAAADVAIPPLPRLRACPQAQIGRGRSPTFI